MKTAIQYAMDAAKALERDRDGEAKAIQIEPFGGVFDRDEAAKIIASAIPIESLVRAVNDARKIIERIGTVGGDSVEQCEAAERWLERIEFNAAMDKVPDVPPMLGDEL